MNLIKILSAILLSCLFGTFIFAQSSVVGLENTEYEIPNEAIKVDDFGRTGECELGARIDNFLAQLQSNPSATGYIIVYQGQSELPARSKAKAAHYQIANYIKFRGFDESLIKIIDGFRAELSYELWLVPSGAEPPSATETVAAPELPEDKSFLYDRTYLADEYGAVDLSEFVLPSVASREAEESRLAEEEYRRENSNAENVSPAVEEPTEIAETEPEPTQEELDERRFFWISEKFGETMKNLENSRGVIFFYADDAYFDINKLQSFIEHGRDRIAVKADIPADKIQVVFGGYRTTPETEFYIVPEHAESPTASPEERITEEVEEAESPRSVK